MAIPQPFQMIINSLLKSPETQQAIDSGKRVVGNLQAQLDRIEENQREILNNQIEIAKFILCKNLT